MLHFNTAGVLQTYCEKIQIHPKIQVSQISVISPHLAFSLWFMPEYQIFKFLIRLLILQKYDQALQNL